MRTREEITIFAKGNFNREVQSVNTLQCILEVMLDIRDLLNKHGDN